MERDEDSFRDSYDVVIVGAGLAGLTCAAALAETGLTCAVLDRGDPRAFTAPAFDGRVTAIAFAAGRMLRRLGVWEGLAEEAEPINDILVTDGRAQDRFRRGGAASAFLHFGPDAEAGEAAPLGWIVENRALRRELTARVAGHPRVRILAPLEISDIRFGPAQVEIDAADRRTVRAPLLVAADGRGSMVRRRAGLRVVEWSYPQTGVVATVRHARPHQGVAQEFFLPDGPFAILPMTRNRSSLVWTEARRRAPALLALDDAGFGAELERRFGPYLGEVAVEGPRWSYPLAFHIASRFVGPRLCLVGDAAHGIHPIAGQGFNLGLKDIAALAEVAGEALSTGLDVGHGAVLERYQRWRRFDSALMAFGTDALNRLFSNDFPPLRAARDIGLAAVNHLAPARKFFMRHAGADLGDLPALMRE